MSLLYIGRIDKLEIGLTAGTNTDITNVILMNWERNHDVRPRLYANLKYPRTYQQPHSWIIGSFSLLRDNHTAIYETDVMAAAGNQYAMYEDADSNVIDFFQVTYQDEDGNNRVTRFFYPIIYRYNKELLNYDDSTWIYHFLAGYAIDAEESPAELNLISADTVSPDIIWVHDKITKTIVTSWALGAGVIAHGLTLDTLGNLCVADQWHQTVYIYVGLSSTISTSFSTPAGTPWGLTLDGSGNLISGSTVSDSIYIHVGVTSTISTSFSAPNGEPSGLTLDEDGNLISADNDTDSIYIHVGVTSVISTSFSSPNGFPTGLTMDKDYNLVSGDALSDSIYIHSGITANVLTSFSHGTNVQGLTTVEV